MSISDRKQREKTEMRNLILDAAMKLFLEVGYEHVTLRKIAEAIEYSPGTVYLYFKDKNEIFYALQTMAFHLFYQNQSAVMSAIANPKERLLKLGEAYLEFALNNPEHYDLMFIMNAPMACVSEDEDWVEGPKTFEFLVQVVSECMEAGELPKGDPLVAAMAFWGEVHGLAALSIRSRFFKLPKEQHLPMLQKALSYMTKLTD